MLEWMEESQTTSGPRIKYSRKIGLSWIMKGLEIILRNVFFILKVWAASEKWM